MSRWLFTDLTTAETYRLPKNPRTMSSLNGNRNTVVEFDGRGVARATRTPVGGFSWQFAGTLHEKAEYDAMLSWAEREMVQLTDHLGRNHRLIPVAFLPTPVERTGTRNPWLYEYTFKSVYLGRLP